MLVGGENDGFSYPVAGTAPQALTHIPDAPRRRAHLDFDLADFLAWADISQFRNSSHIPRQSSSVNSSKYCVRLSTPTRCTDADPVRPADPESASERVRPTASRVPPRRLRRLAPPSDEEAVRRRPWSASAGAIEPTSVEWADLPSAGAEAPDTYAIRLVREAYATPSRLGQNRVSQQGPTFNETASITAINTLRACRPLTVT